MGAPVPHIQQVVNEYASGLSAEIEALSNTLADGHRAMGSLAGWWGNRFGDNIPPPPEYRREIAGRWTMGVDMHHEQIPENLNPDICHKFEANEFGNCINLHWCFRVFGVELKCQQTRKEVVPKPMKEHRKLEVD